MQYIIGSMSRDKVKLSAMASFVGYYACYNRSDTILLGDTMYYGEPSYMSSSYGYGGQYFPNITKLDDKIAQMDAQSVYTTNASEENSQSWNMLLQMLYDAAHTEGGEQIADILLAKMDFANMAGPGAGLWNWDAQTVKTAAMALDPVVVAQQASLPKTSQAWKRASNRFNFTSKVPAAEAAATPPTNGSGSGGTNGQNGEDPPNGGLGFGDMYLGYLALVGLGVAAYGVYQVKVKKKKFLVFKPKRAALANSASRY
jgi:hypothetical protein